MTGWHDRRDEAAALIRGVTGAPVAELDGAELARWVDLGIAVSAAAVDERIERERRGNLRLVASGGVTLAIAPPGRHRRTPRWRRWLHRGRRHSGAVGHA